MIRRSYARAQKDAFTRRGKYVRESGVVCMNGSNIALVKFFLSSNVGAHRLTVFTLPIVCAIIPYNPVTRFDWSTVRGIRDEDLYPLIFLSSAISVASLLARACRSSIDYCVQRHYTLSRDTYICIHRTLVFNESKFI